MDRLVHEAKEIARKGIYSSNMRNVGEREGWLVRYEDGWFLAPGEPVPSSVGFTIENRSALGR